MKFKILYALFLLFPIACQAEIDEKQLKEFCEYEIMKYDMLLIESFHIDMDQYDALVPYNQGYITGKREAYAEILFKFDK